MQTVEVIHRLVQQKDVKDIMCKYTNLFSVACAYPITIFDGYMSSFVNQIFHCVLMASFSCPVQGNFLIVNTKIKTE